MFERVSLIRFCTVTNEKLTIDDKQTANLFVGHTQALCTKNMILCNIKWWILIQVNFKASSKFAWCSYRSLD